MHDCRMLPPRIAYNSTQYLGKDRRHHAAARQRAFSTSIINNPDKHCRQFDRRRAALAVRAGWLSAASSPHERSDMRESASQIEPRISLRSSGLRSRRSRAQRSIEPSARLRSVQRAMAEWCAAHPGSLQARSSQARITVNDEAANRQPRQFNALSP